MRLPDSDVAKLASAERGVELKPLQGREVRRLLRYMEWREIEEVSAIDWDQYFDEAILPTTSGEDNQAAAIRALEQALAITLSGSWRHIGDGRTRKTAESKRPLWQKFAPPFLSATQRECINAWSGENKAIVGVFFKALRTVPHSDAAVLETAFSLRTYRSRKSIEVVRRQFGQQLARCLDKLALSTWSGSLVRRHFGVKGPVRYPYLEIERWPLHLAEKAISGRECGSLSDQLIRRCGQFLAFLDRDKLSVESIDESTFQEFLQQYNQVSATTRAGYLKDVLTALWYLDAIAAGIGSSTLHQLYKDVWKECVDRGSYKHKGRRATNPKRAVPLECWPPKWQAGYHALKADSTEDFFAWLERQSFSSSDIGREFSTWRDVKLSERSLELMLECVGLFIDALRTSFQQGWADRTSWDGSIELTPTTIQLFINTLRARGARTSTVAFDVKSVYSFARNGLCLPAEEISWLQRTYRRLVVISKNEPKRKDAKELPSLDQVWTAAKKLRNEARAEPAHQATTFRKYRDAAILAMSCQTGLRNGDLSFLEWKTEVRRDEKTGLWTVSLSQGKSGGRYRVKLWPAVGAFLDEFVERYGQNRNAGDCFWTRCGKKPSEGWLGTVFKLRLGINPHSIRDIIAEQILWRAPENYWAISDLLGHADPETQEHYADQARSIAASKAVRTTLRQSLGKSRETGHDLGPRRSHRIDPL